MGRGGFGSYGAGLFEHRHVTLRVAPAEVRRVCNFVKDQCAVEIARFGQNAEDLEYDCGLAFLHAPLRTLVLSNSLVRPVQARG
jgi:hypothetical protein